MFICFVCLLFLKQNFGPKFTFVMEKRVKNEQINEMVFLFKKETLLLQL